MASKGKIDKCPYEILGIDLTATAAEIQKAYKKGALKWHPDKNRDNPDAAIKFEQLVEAKNILSDEKAKAAYDQVLKNKRSRELADLKLTAEQRKLKRELEKREEEADQRKRRKTEAFDQQLLEQEIIRLRAESNRLLEEEQESLRSEALAEQTNSTTQDAPTGYTLKLKWSTKSTTDDNGGYDLSTLNRLFCKYGPVDIRVSQKKAGVAYVSYSSAADALLAHNEGGLHNNPFKYNTWAQEDDGIPNRNNFEDALIDNAPAIDVLNKLEKDVFAMMTNAHRLTSVTR
eukprot:m.170072 g.170072  ORF g.170072 m.170072 type:complete len:288 (-) comp31604_c0_seq3:90-953(-)